GLMEPMVKQQSSADWLDYWSEQTKPDPVLAEFMEECGTSDMLEKVAQWCEESFAFANALHVNDCEEALKAEGIMKRAQEDFQVKQASEKKKVTLGIHFDMHEGISKEASEGLFKKGYMVEDHRPKEDLTVVYSDNEECMTNVAEPGIYDVIMKDGSIERAICAPSIDVSICNGLDGLEPPIRGSISQCDPQFRNSHSPKITVVLQDSRKTTCGRGVVGRHIDMIQPHVNDEEIFEKHMATGGCYRICDANDFALTCPIHVVSSNVKDGMIVYEILTDSYGKSKELTYNPHNVHNDLKQGVIGPAARFVKIEANKPKKEGNGCWSWPYYEDEPSLGNQVNLDNWIFGHMKPLQLYKKEAGFQFRYGDRRWSSQMDKVASLIHLTKDLQIPAEDAEDMLEKTAAERESTWYLDVNNAVKRAAVIRIADSEDFDMSDNSDFGVQEDRPHFQALETEYDHDEIPHHRIGDRYDNSMGMGEMGEGEPHPGEGVPIHVLMNSSPEELAQMAENVPQVFEHGVVGSLAQTFDSTAMVDKYIPKLEEALDSIGRMLFLYYWKPGDFQDSYGADDMINLENELLSNFKSLGEMTLGLLKKSRGASGSVPLHS
ncbi:MAG: hypothetical protein NWE76_01790, partial [Candidatus Bathyarchaeota archaeon]|nr:hypothetical protein [Candidatus Bathyarchaeota archaeon]